MSMSLRPAAALAAAAVLFAFAPARAADGSPPVESERYGSLATGMPYDREIRLGGNTKSIGVWRLETVRFVAAGGSEFRWRFDGLPPFDTFPLARIAPAGFSAPPDAVVFVNGEFPVGP